MPVHYEFDDPIVLLRMQGTYTTDEMKREILRALADPRCPPDAVLLFDLQASISLPRRSADEVRDMARFLGENGAMFHRRLAMVATSDVAYGLMRLGAVTAESNGVAAEVFRTMEPARRWLLGSGGADPA